MQGAREPPSLHTLGPAPEKHESHLVSCQRVGVRLTRAGAPAGIGAAGASPVSPELNQGDSPHGGAAAQGQPGAPPRRPPAQSPGSPQGRPRALRPPRCRTGPAELPAWGRAAHRLHRGRGLGPLCARRSGGAGARGLHLARPLGRPAPCACQLPAGWPVNTDQVSGPSQEHLPCRRAKRQALPALSCFCSYVKRAFLPRPLVRYDLLSFPIYERNPPHAAPSSSSSAQGPPPLPPPPTRVVGSAGPCASAPGRKALWCPVSLSPRTPPGSIMCSCRAGGRCPEATGGGACGVGLPPSSFVLIKCGSWMCVCARVGHCWTRDTGCGGGEGGPGVLAVPRRMKWPLLAPLF